MLDGKEYDIEAAPFLEKQSNISQELTLLLNQQKIISEDMEDEIVVKRRRTNIDEPDIQFFERAYAATIVPKVMGATACQKKRRFDTSRFKKAVLNAYNAARVESGAQFAWCWTWYETSVVRAAHLVPKSLNPREVAYLFGIKEASDDFFYD